MLFQSYLGWHTHKGSALSRDTEVLCLTTCQLWRQYSPKKGSSMWFQGHYPPCSSLSNPASHDWAKKSLKTTCSLANDVVLQKVSPGWKTAQNGESSLFYQHSREEVPAKRDQTSWECFEKLMETRVPVTLLSHSTPACGKAFWNPSSQPPRLPEVMPPAALSFPLQAERNILLFLSQQGNG